MIEGGAALIGACAAAGHAHKVIVTLAPQTLVHGLRPAARHAGAATAALSAEGCLRRVEAFCLGDDVVVSGDGPAAARPAVAQQMAARL